MKGAIEFVNFGRPDLEGAITARQPVVEDRLEINLLCCDPLKFLQEKLASVSGRPPGFAAGESQMSRAGLRVQ